MRRSSPLIGMLITLLACLWPTAASADSVSIGVTIGPPPPPPVVVAVLPQLVVVPGTPVYYAPALSVNYFFYGGRYYTFHNGAWFYAAAHNGPWTFIALERVPPPILVVPVTYYKAPPGHWKKKGPPPWAEHRKERKHKK